MSSYHMATHGRLSGQISPPVFLYHLSSFFNIMLACDIRSLTINVQARTRALRMMRVRRRVTRRPSPHGSAVVWQDVEIISGREHFSTTA